MNVPLVSVILPAYNSEKFIGKAIQSVLQQTFTDFELIIINDGSTDKTEFEILAFADPKIVYLKNQTNKGLVFTLNKGIDLANGKYIARMDGDDISLPQRFKKQLSYLQENSSVDILATVVKLIDENDQDAGNWSSDAKNISSQDIRRELPKDNCIAHPSVMGTTSVFKKYKFNKSQVHGEDYDLWLRMAADNVIIHKLPEPLLKHRILSSSFTRTRQKNVFWKIAKLKLRFAWQQVTKGRFNSFIAKTFFFGCIDVVKGFGKDFINLFRK
jgi:glycosyltransferase involved in cell wall biosynthesis